MTSVQAGAYLEGKQAGKDEAARVIIKLYVALAEAREYVQSAHNSLAHTNAQEQTQKMLNKIDAALRGAEGWR